MPTTVAPARRPAVAPSIAQALAEVRLLALARCFHIRFSLGGQHEADRALAIRHATSIWSATPKPMRRHGARPRQSRHSVSHTPISRPYLFVSGATRKRRRVTAATRLNLHRTPLLGYRRRESGRPCRVCRRTARSGIARSVEVRPGGVVRILSGCGTRSREVMTEETET